MSETIEVECYAGYRADESPIRFRLGARWMKVSEISDRWYGPSEDFFKLVGEDGNVYILKHDIAGGWSLAAYRRTATR